MMKTEPLILFDTFLRTGRTDAFIRIVTIGPTLLDLMGGIRAI